MTDQGKQLALNFRIPPSPERLERQLEVFVDLNVNTGRIEIRFKYDAAIVAAIKDNFTGYQYHSDPPRRWSLPVSEASINQLGTVFDHLTFSEDAEALFKHFDAQ